MCEMMESEPLEEEIPFEREDLTIDTQEVFNMYDKLPARWDGMSGTYLGKDLNLLPVLCVEYEVENYLRKYAWHIIPIIDSYVSEDIAEKTKRKTKGTPSGNHS